MSRLISFVAGVAVCSLVCLAYTSAGAAPAEVSTAATAAPRARALPELREGFFRVNMPGRTQGVGWVWVRDVSGVLRETWILFRPDLTDGWIPPSDENVTVPATFVHQPDVEAATLAEFKTWAEDQYPSGWNVDADEDFEIHEHTVTIL